MLQISDHRLPPPRLARAGLMYAWAGVAIMWVFWTTFIVFLAQPVHLLAVVPLPALDGAEGGPLPGAVLVDALLIGLFGLQHSVMARPSFKRLWADMPEAWQRVTYVHMANVALLALVFFWQPIPGLVWSIPEGGLAYSVAWGMFGLGWLILFAGAWSFGILELLGVRQMQAWAAGCAFRPVLKTSRLYRILPHPMYVGVLMGVWVTPRMTVGHLFLAAGMTLYVLIALRYEERDLSQRYGAAYRRWRHRYRLPA